MDQLSYSREGFAPVEDDYVPDLEQGCVVEFQVSETEKSKIMYKFSSKKDGFLYFYDLEVNPQKEIGFIFYDTENDNLEIRYKSLEANPLYTKKGIMSVGTSLLANFAQKKLGVKKIEGIILNKNDKDKSLKSRLLTRDLHTNSFLKTYRNRFYPERVITYLGNNKPGIIQQFVQKRVNL